MSKSEVIAGSRWIEIVLFAVPTVLLLWSIGERLFRGQTFWGSSPTILLNVAIVLMATTPFVRARSKRYAILAASSIALLGHWLVR